MVQLNQVNQGSSVLSKKEAKLIEKYLCSSGKQNYEFNTTTIFLLIIIVILCVYIV
jgi:hypothetical protein